MTEIGKRLLDNLPPKINRKGEIVSAMFANETGTGALEKMFIYGDTVKNNYSQAGNVYEMDGNLMDQAMNVLSYFERFYLETDKSFIKRNKSIFIRKGDTTWGTTWNVKHVFEYYFPKAKIFLLDNIGPWDENILINSNFESAETEEIEKWTLDGCEIAAAGAFAGAKGILFTENGGEVSQSADVTTGKYYFVTCAYNGEISIKITGEQGDLKKLYKIGEKIGTGAGSARTSKTESWDFVQYLFYADKSEEVTVSISGKNGDKVDLVTLDEKQKYPRFTLYVWFDGVTLGGKTLHLAQNGDDPIEGVDYDKESYYGNAFFQGSSGKSFANDIYNDILTMIKAAGTKADIMLLTKETV